MPTGTDLLHLAETRLREKYENVLVPKDNAHWHGPWDCAEFASWVVYQQTHVLYGCDLNHGKPSLVDAYSGYWVRDAAAGLLIATTQALANAMAGIVLLRKPPLPGQMGHVALTDGKGGTVEAAGRGLHVRRDKVEGRLWHYCVQIPGVAYQNTGVVTPSKPLPFLLTLEQPNIKSALVGKVQHALKAAGFSPGVLDEEYGPHTVAAVAAFQARNRLVSDGVVGPLTAKKLGVAWP
ncbi:peptidoglycan-binding domain-containing protein [Hymenobacter rubripertinctus]|uniref:Peptidoglycan-binding protein n=1 Tax=Hymenobacter rubripertinctus TaxID=2029981 RepID=A0A418QS23_9BACT|nr:peptidoglycan-binding domain-containing protein [Hymenobacter rubripertinctus]RIY07820.1 peptidoglycan-binding protein [Hymenobacter rubripertinctus]